MVLFNMPSGHLSMKPSSQEQLTSSVKAEMHTTSPSYLGAAAQQWHTHGPSVQDQPGGLTRMTSSHGRFRMLQVPEVRDCSEGQASPKVEHRQLYGREREREDCAQEQRKRMKVQNSVHTVSSQMQSQLLSPRGPAGTSVPASTRDCSVPGPNYVESNNHSCNRAMSRMAPSGPPLTRSEPAVNALDEPSPLGLTLRKTPSLLDLISMKLAQGGSGDGSPNADSVAQDAAKNRPTKCLVPSVTAQDKMKASNFPATSLKIGTWERTSRYEGDLVGKCYYAKRKLVWEVLESGLKSKIEIQWSDISAMKASCPENLPGTLEIEVSRPPLFFRETNPQPRKHTLWQTASDFTGGQATVCKRHSLQFPEGVLNRHYEKLVQCDPRLKALVEGALSTKPMPDFDQQPGWMFDAKHQQNLPAHQPIGGHHNSALDGNSSELPVFHHSHHLLSLAGSGLVNHAGLLSDPKTEVRPIKMQPNDLSSPSSVMDPRGNDDSGASDTEDLKLHDDYEYDIDLTYPTQPNIGAHHDLPDVKPSCNNLFLIGENALSQENRRLAEIRQCLLDEISGSNEQNGMVNGARLGQHNGRFSSGLANELPHSFSPATLETQPDAGHLYPLGTMVKSEAGGPEDHNWPGSSSAMNGRLFHRDPSLNSLMSCFASRHGSANDLLLNLPRVASLPQLFETPQQVPTGGYDLPYSRPSYLGSEKLR